ncbi:MAG: acetolactate synthase small subunit [Spirochaetes bacterium]|jgi:acetolactate synthase-1/3 small subunit|nr:acetolactate synthase small subunit [Spirochaetota bacterium]
MEREYTIAVLVENKSGVLAHIAGLFSGRGFNILELSVGETENREYSRMTIVVKGDDKIVEQIKKQLNKFIDVIKVIDMTGKPAVNREIILIKVTSPPGKRQEIFQIAEVFKGKIVDISHETLTLEVTGTNAKIEAVISILKPFGIHEIARTGRVSISRGSSTIGGTGNG